MKIADGLTYDDILLEPKRSYIDHRSDVLTQTRLTRNIRLNIPLISANMDTVTENEMAKALAKEGGIGIIHRFMTIDQQINEVRKVKRFVGFVLENPYVLSPNSILADVWKESKEKTVDGFIIVDDSRKIIGILSHRDYHLYSDPKIKIIKLMTSRKKLIVGNINTSLNEAKKIFQRYKIEKLPLVDRENKLVGLITARTVADFEKSPFASKDKFGRYLVGAAIGVVNDFSQRAEGLVKAGCDVLVVDVAHGHNQVALKTVSQIRKRFRNVDLIGGNIATSEGTLELIKRGVDAVKVGIGPGGLCTTRIVTGVGIPQFTAVANCSLIGEKYDIPIIADGGTNFPGDFVKALAAGASSCMLAGWFAGTDESPGEIILRKGLKYKAHRGSASFLATADRQVKLGNSAEQNLNTIVPEGIEALVPYKGKVSDVILQLMGAIRSGMSYCNAKNIKELQKNATFIKITEAGFRENKSHNVEEI